VPVHGVPTFYARFGDLFSWSCVMGLGLLIITGLVRGPRRAEAPTI
jgi:hypothetical protein